MPRDALQREPDIGNWRIACDAAFQSAEGSA
jgi:hypothetical protein